MEISDAVVSIS